YDLAPFFRLPLRDAAAVGYRHEVMRDLEANRAAVTEFAERMHTVREALAQADRLRYRYQKETWFLDAARGYCAAVTGLARSLERADLASRGLTGFREYLRGYADSAGFTRLRRDADDVAAALDAVRYCVTLKGSRVTVARYDGEADFSADVVTTFAKFARGAVRDYRARFRTWPDMNHIEEQIADRVARLFPDEFAALDTFAGAHGGFRDATVTTFDRQVQFYLAYLDFTAPMKAAGLEFCYPDVTTQHKGTDVKAAFDLALAAKLAPGYDTIVRNDFRLSGEERILVVTGPNHGGKTTFARMTGQLHYLASLGYPVPAKSARLFLPDRVFTHFEREEDLATLRGKLADELHRIRDVLEDATGDSLLVMNESFASTTLRDATFIGERILRQMTELGLLGVYVTFVDELTTATGACVSMVGGVNPDDPAERTYRIERRPADGLAYATAIARKHRLTYPQLAGRLAGGEDA
ncbi:MAG: DNA mismatch repair protein MutS, partial [Actinobacteria bacterium]|nr:DNA mismatch repair protein MutS [Actinomycetota bacterium]